MTADRGRQREALKARAIVGQIPSDGSKISRLGWMQSEQGSYDTPLSFSSIISRPLLISQFLFDNEEMGDGTGEAVRVTNPKDARECPCVLCRVKLHMHGLTFRHRMNSVLLGLNGLLKDSQTCGQGRVDWRS